METFFVVSAIVALIIIGGKLGKEYFKWLSKDMKRKR